MKGLTIVDIAVRCLIEKPNMNEKMMKNDKESSMICHRNGILEMAENSKFGAEGKESRRLNLV